MPSQPESGLQPNEDRPHILYVSPGQNLSWPEKDRNISYNIPSGKYTENFMYAPYVYTEHTLKTLFFSNITAVCDEIYYPSEGRKFTEVVRAIFDVFFSNSTEGGNNWKTSKIDLNERH